MSTKQYKKTRIYTVLKILKVTSLNRYTDFIYVRYLSLSLEKINKSLRKCQLHKLKDLYLHGLKNIESDESE